MADNRTYAQDLALLRSHTDVIEMTDGDARVAVAPAYQARVMTSTLAGPDSPGYGWLNDEFIAAGEENTKSNNYGGEDRFWLGPEAGQFGLWFAPNEPMDRDHWKTPRGFGNGPWEVAGRDACSVATSRRFEVRNYSETTFPCVVERVLRLVNRSEAAALLGTAVPDGWSALSRTTC